MKQNVFSVNIADLTKDPVLGPFLIGPVVPNRRIVDVETGMIDGKAIVLECEEERAESIIKVIRLKYKPHQLRCYKNSKRI